MNNNCMCDYGAVKMMSTPNDSAKVWFQEYIDTFDLYLKHRLVLQVNDEEEFDLNINYCPICGKRLSRPIV